MVSVQRFWFADYFSTTLRVPKHSTQFLTLRNTKYAVKNNRLESHYLFKLGSALTSPFTKRLKHARTQRGLSQKKLGILIGIEESVASSRMNHYETGRHAPDYLLVSRIAASLDLPTAYFYTEEDWLAEKIIELWQYFRSSPSSS